MYSIDINFLRDRHLEDSTKTATQVSKAPAPTLQQQVPMYIGVGAMLVLLALPMGLLSLINWQTGKTAENINQLNAKIAELKAQNEKLTTLQNELKALDEDIQSYVSVFNQIRPASAILQEIRNLIPSSVQVTNVAQGEIPSTQPGQPATIQLTLNGYAAKFDDVNKFLLALQKSRFLNPQGTRIMSARLVDSPVILDGEATDIRVEFPKVVQYTMVTELNNLPASQLLPDLARNGALGLVTRIKILEDKGVLTR